MNNVYTYTFKFDEPVKISNVNYYNSSAGEGYGQTADVMSEKIDGLTTNADENGYATEFTIEYNFNKLNLVENNGTVYIKGDGVVLTFEDKSGNKIDVSKVNDSNITLSILR